MMSTAFFTVAAFGQRSNVTCNPDYEWTFNSKGQSPCLVSAHLQSECGSAISVNEIPPGIHYTGPGLSNANLCNCNTVVYSLTSACGSCQGRAVQNWTRWANNCPNNAQFISEFPKDIPASVEVPAWAYINVTASGGQLWNPIEAKIIADQIPPAASESSVSHSSTPTGSSTDSGVKFTSTSASTVRSEATSEPSNGEGGPKAGAIAGGVVGGIVFLIAVGLLLLWFILRKRRKAATEPPPGFTIDGNSLAGLGTTSPPPASFRANAMSPVSRTTYDDSFDTRLPVPMSPTSVIQTTITTRRSQETLDNATHFGTQLVSVRPRGYTGAAEI